MNASRLISRLKALQPAPSRGKAVSAPAVADATPRGHSPDIPEGATRLTEILEASVRSNKFGDHLALRKWFSEPVASAPDLGVPDGELNSEALRLMAPGAPKEVADPRQWLFLDTETTGLAGGTGTYPFLVGIGWWDACGLEVEQFFMRDHSEEHSVLSALAERMAERPVLVTFNGKSFDWPLLENRFTMTRAIKVPPLAAHLDLLHPARALWKLRLGSVRLVELERHVLDTERLGWHRGNDVASALIPQFYFDYLRGGTADPLAGVVKHNQMDL
ncbi:MAG TPA: ribonuclease H-like domain-containing protein, partial [Candidatus Acidoferrales bacterium]|nr:ribonuclease H-like domain-containing protein [Candidatus Acidoferrales bacterium]